MTTDFSLYVQDRSGVKSGGSFATLEEAHAAAKNARGFGVVPVRIEERAFWGTTLVRTLPIA
jgi:hypothetical protein